MLLAAGTVTQFWPMQVTTCRSGLPGPTCTMQLGPLGSFCSLYYSSFFLAKLLRSFCNHGSVNQSIVRFLKLSSIGIISVLVQSLNSILGLSTQKQHVKVCAIKATKVQINVLLLCCDIMSIFFQLWCMINLCKYLRFSNQIRQVANGPFMWSLLIK